jgi:hypothetical protein
MFALSMPIASGKIIYVDDDAPVSSVEDRNGGLNDGSSWENAYNHLQEALDDSEIAERPVENRIFRQKMAITYLIQNQISNS